MTPILSRLLIASPPPASISDGASFGMVVDAGDAQGNAATSFSGAITLALVGGPLGGALSGTLTVAAVACVISFSGLIIEHVGSGYQIDATASGITSPPVSNNVTAAFTAPKITRPNELAIIYRTALSASQLDATGSVPGSSSYSPPSGTLLQAGSHTLSVTFTLTDASEYATATATSIIAVAKAPPSLKWAAPAPVVEATPLSAAQLDATANVPGTFSYSPAAGTVFGLGIFPLSVTFMRTDATDCKEVCSTVSLTVPSTRPSPPAPEMVIGEKPVFARKFNKRGKPVGKAVLSGFTLDFSAALDPSAASNAANYQIDALTTSKGKHYLLPLRGLKVFYSSTRAAATIEFGSPASFSGGKITIPRAVTGVSSGQLAGPRVVKLRPRGFRAARKTTSVARQ